MKYVATCLVLLMSTPAWASDSAKRGPGPGPGTPLPGCVRIEGLIGQIDASAQQFTVAGTVVQVTEDTVLKMRGQLITFADLAVGQTIAVCGLENDDLVTANRVTVKYGGDTGQGVVDQQLTGRRGPGGGPNDPNGPLGDCIRIEGVISGIDGTAQQLTVDGTPVQVTDDTRIKMGRTLITFDDLAIGQTVAVGGVMEGDTLVAQKITVKYQGQ
ncbi:MAG: hypothetical protein GY778_03630 [bacterium]|nr:hypothetical protein [bacterium]